MTAQRKRRLSAKQLLKKAIAALPEKADLYYVTYDELLNNGQIAKVLGGEKDEVVEEIRDFILDNDADAFSIDSLLEDALPDQEDRDKLRNSDLFNEFRLACQEIDSSTPYADMLKNTRRRMVRFRIQENGEPVEMHPDSWRWDGEQSLTEARRLATSAGINHDDNAQNMLELVENATYGGTLYVLAYVDVRDLDKAVEHILRDEAKHRARITFDNPYLLVLDRLNGSGHDVRVHGQISFEFGRKDLNTCSGIMQLDHKQSGTGYSWSDDVAGVHYPAYESNPKVELLVQSE